MHIKKPKGRFNLGHRVHYIMFYFSTDVSLKSFKKSEAKHEYLKTEILSISVTCGRFPRVVRVPPRSQALCVVTPGHTFPAGVAALHSNQISEILNESTLQAHYIVS